MNDRQLNFTYLHSNKIGYGVHGLATHRGLTNIGIDVYDAITGSGDNDIAGKRAGICKDALFLTIPTHVNGWWEGQRAHIFTMHEGTEVPESFRDNLDHFETLMVPSQACVEAFSNYHTNVKYVPLGVDSATWRYRRRNHEDMWFNFMISGMGNRKGLDLTHKAFLKVFRGRKTDGPIPRLIMKIPKNVGEEKFYGENVTIINGYMSKADEVSLYETIHCYVQPSRGEGWGMQPLQAIAQGIPTILTNAHGHVPFAKYGYGLSATKVKTEYLAMYGRSGDWWEPNFDELCAHMEWVYDNYAEAERKAEINSASAIQEFTWENSALKIVEAIGGSAQLRERFETLPTKWVSPTGNRRFRLITNRNYRADIGGIVYMFLKGKEYWELADVKRVLFESGVLDPASLDDGAGLSEGQLALMNDYRADHQACPTCGRGGEDDPIRIQSDERDLQVV